MADRIHIDTSFYDTLIARLDSLSTNGIGYTLNKGTSCVNGHNPNDGSFIWTSNEDSLKDNLQMVADWMIHEHLKTQEI